MSTLRSVIWRIAQSTTECDCAICTSCTGSGQIASPGSPPAARQPGSRTPARQQPASPAAGRQPGSNPPARQQDASPAATRQPGSRTPARQQPASPAAGRQPGSNPPAQQQPDSQAATRQPSSNQTARQQPASPAATRQLGSYVIYAPARAGAPAPRRSNVPARACAGAQDYCARARGLCGFGSAKVGQVCNFFWHFR